MMYLGLLGVLGLICLSGGLLLSLHDERKTNRAREEIWEKQRRDLLNRIQMPQAAPFMDDGTIAVADLKGPAYVPFDDDEAYWAAREERALTRADEADGN